MNAAIKIDKMNLKKNKLLKYKAYYLIWKIFMYMEMFCRPPCRAPGLPTAVAPLHSQPTEIVGTFHQWKSPHKRKTCLIRLTVNTPLFFPKVIIQSFLWNKVVLPLLTSPNNKIASEMTYKTTATLDKLAFTHYIDFGKCQDRFGRISGSKNSFDYLDVKLKMFKKDESKQIRLARNLTMGEADFNQFIRLRNQLVVAVRDFSKEENLPPVQVKLLAKDMEEQLKLTHKIVEVVDQSHRKICVTMLRNNEEKTRDFICSSRIVWKKKARRKIQSNC